VAGEPGLELDLDLVVRKFTSILVAPASRKREDSSGGGDEMASALAELGITSHAAEPS
jgi:hypothetical protein